jgi:hypothetical protein
MYQLIRLAWAQEHFSWTDEQRGENFWSDESWVQVGYHKTQWCTGRVGPSEFLSPRLRSTKVSKENCVGVLGI